MRRRSIKGTVLAVFLMAAVAVTMIPAGLAVCSDRAQAAAVYTYTMQRPAVKINGHNAHVTKFTVSGLGLTGTCCQAGTRARVGKTTVQRLSNTDIRARLMYYYGYQKGYVGKTDKNGFLLCRALSWLSGNPKTKPVTLTEVKNYINAMPSTVTVPNRFECYFCDPTDGQQNFIAFRMTAPGYVALNKTSTDAFALAAGSGYSFEGIEYTVYDSKGAAVGKLTCRANGTTNVLTLDTGAYTVRETKTNQWYKMNPQTYSTNLTSGQTWTISASDSPQTGIIRVKKKVVGKYDGDLAFTFRLVNTANPNIAYRVTTDAETGEASTEVLQGTYRCEEILPEDAGVVDLTGPQTAAVKIGETYTFERTNKTLSSGMLQVSKSTDDGGPAEGFRFKIRGVLYNQGVLTEETVLDAADISLIDFDEDVYTPGEWNVSAEELEKLNKAAAERETGSRKITLSNRLKYTGEKGVSVSEFVQSLSGEDTVGTIPTGTLINDDNKVLKAKEDIAFAIDFAEEEQGEQIHSGESERRVIDQEKTEENIRELLSGETFEEVDTSDIEVSAEVSVDLKHVEYIYDSEEPENSGYEADVDKQIRNKRQTTEEKEKYKIKFNNFDWNGAATIYQEIRNGELTGNTEVTIETGAGGLTEEISEGITHGRFTVEEVMTDAQKKQYRQPQSQTKEITKKDGAAAFLFNFENKARWAGVKLAKTSTDGNVSGITFRLEGTDIRGEKIDREAVTDVDGKIDFGNLYAGEYVISEKDFDPDKYENNYRLDGYDVPAQRLVITGDETEAINVAFENVPLKSLYLTKVDKETQLFLKNAVFSLFDGEKQLALFRIVLDDYGRAGIDMIRCDESSGIRVSKPQVSIFPDEDNTNSEPEESAGNDQVTIVEPDTDTDTDSGSDNSEANTEAAQAEYNFALIRGLKEGKTYTLKEITAPAGYAASINYTFTFEDGQKLVLENAAPEIATTAVDKKTGNHMSNAEGMVTIVDTVSYRNLGPGHKYLLSGVLAYKPTGERTVEELEDDAEETIIIKDAKGREVTAQKEFVPQSESGTVDIEFTFDASLLNGLQVVAMEQLVDPALTGVNGVITVVASHEDIDDAAQSIYFPQIGTKASADDTGKRVTEADDEIMITDTVEYSNVIAGKVYEMTGTLMDRETGKPLLSGGAEITATVQFRAEKDGPVFAAEGETLEERTDGELELVSGTLELHFTFDGSALAGKQAVAFEELTTGGKLVGEHSDLNDEEQTVYLPSINTTASTNGTDTVSDKVIYTNLLPGETYIMRGVLMDKSTGEELLLNGEPVTAEMEFVPQEKDGEVTIEFPVDAKALLGKSAVVFETCYVATPADTPETAGEIEIISHRDINNKAQTVTFKVPQTGQAVPWGILLPVGLLAAFAAGIALRMAGKAGGSW